ncbi:YhcN/YlaJ family sporulation lipoprotein [Halalkalibacter krulwichiae]|uniref:Sporulation lipoprotein YhcN/YlaJ (Spore_YhcN_YlaJ) n=1 Tax=Halalkalibacter krulwichiae TaxID=199441 RepID=A0A1X9MER2_9BACI|nr:YhcN/YlaJ family sporulation lipoprotein [Halalkalibacter krulwichiae]ARK31935.1 Sporulation lipoprotein YhcN/YlaJ (Spore_YhcN_YlaJ) [Halalkalibacter krulwichiae]
MIKKSLLVAGLCGLMLSTGCQMPEQGQSLQRTANYDSHQPNAGHYPINRATQTENYTHFGYQRYDREHVNNNGRQDVIPVVDRSLLADAVTRMVLTNDVVSEAGTLVTDKYVLVAYDAQADNREFVADQVKRSALSIVPRYYEVYITDDTDHFDEIERFQNLSSEADGMTGALEQTIEEMKGNTPQGEYNEDTDDNIEIMEHKTRRLMDR